MSSHLQSVLLLVLSLFLVLLNGFFVAAEFSLVKLRATRIEELVAKGKFGAKKVRNVQQHMDAYLSATQLGVTLASLGLGSLGEPTLAHLLEPHVGGWQAHIVAATIAFTVITYFHIVIGELIPKWAAIERSEAIALYFVYPLDVFYWVFRLPIVVLHRTAVVFARLLGLEPSAEGGEAHSEEELRLILSASHAGGEINASEVQLVNQVFNFAHQQAKEIMVPRPDVVFLSTERSLTENIRIAEQSGFTRFPLMEDSPDEIHGMIHIRELLRLQSRLHEDARASGKEVVGDDAAQLRGLTRDVLRIPETKPIDRLLREFQRGRQHMAVVVDEYGGTAGIVTLEDIVEEIVGDIQDEFDRATPELEPIGKDCYAVDARMPLTKLERALGIDGPAEESEVDTIGGWVLASAEGRAVGIGQEVAYGDATVTVLEMSGRRVLRVRVCIPESARGMVSGGGETENETSERDKSGSAPLAA